MCQWIYLNWKSLSCQYVKNPFYSVYFNTRAAWVPSTWEWNRILRLVFLMFYYEVVPAYCMYLVLFLTCSDCSIEVFFFFACMHKYRLRVSTHNCWGTGCMLCVFIPTCESKLFRGFLIYLYQHSMDGGKLFNILFSELWWLDADVEYSYFMLVLLFFLSSSPKLKLI